MAEETKANNTDILITFVSGIPNIFAVIIVDIQNNNDSDEDDVSHHSPPPFYFIFLKTSWTLKNALHFFVYRLPASSLF